MFRCCIVFLFLTATLVNGQGKTQSRIQKRMYQFKEADKEMEYALFVPSTYDKEKKSPLIVALHGLNGNPQQFIRSRGLTDQAEKHGYIVVAPMGYNPRGWYGIKTFMKKDKDAPENLAELSEKDVMNVLGIVRKDFNVDENRIYLMGHSMGGAGTVHIATKNPDLFAALGPIAPALVGKPRLEKIKGVPIILIQGDKDTAVKVENIRPWADEMKKLKMTYEYVEVAGGNHGSVVGEKMADIFEFFNKHKKEAK
jgi:poly(3-hydroxybutyrate) depolymerase